MDFLRSLRDVHAVAVQKVLPPKPVRDQVIRVYREALEAVVKAKVVTETPKARIINVEFPRYWDNYGSLYYALMEAVEHTHSKFAHSQVAHGTKIRVDIGSAKHQETLLRGVTYMTSQNMNLLPKLSTIDEEETPEGTFQSLAELDNAEDTVESLRRQLTEAREETSQARHEAAVAREQVALAREEAADARQEVAVRDKIVEVFIFIKLCFKTYVQFRKKLSRTMLLELSWRDSRGRCS